MAESRLDDSQFQVSENDIVLIASKFKDSALRPSGIPLTEEWLLKFGFEKTDPLVFEKDILPKIYRIRVINPKPGDFVAVLINDIDGLQECAIRAKQYVHQLQNLFFALTGKELEMKN